MTPSPSDIAVAKEIVTENLKAYSDKGDWNVSQSFRDLVDRFAQALANQRESQIRADAEFIDKLDPLEAKGDFWEYGQTDDVAYGVQNYLAKQLLSQLNQEVRG